MQITYSLNMMGPWHTGWYIERGLTEKKTIVLEKDSLISDLKAGDTVEIDEITEYYSAGRLEIYGKDLYPDERAVPPMRSDDWNNFDDWLRTFETDDKWTLQQLVEMYEKDNPKIRWWEEKL
jgi:hypothetical protein